MWSRPRLLVRVAAALAVTAVAACETENGERGGKDSDWAEFAVEPVSAPTRGEVPALAPAQRVTCPSPTMSVGDSASLENALADAQPEDVIELDAGTYDGNFVATVEATVEEPIYLCGPPEAELAGEGPEESGYVLHLDGADYWRVVGLTVRDGRKGVMVDGGVGNVVQGLTVTHIGDEAIHLRAHSTDNAVLDNEVSDTGIRRDTFGEGIYIGSAITERRAPQPDSSCDGRAARFV